jgi:hypothetical protein
MKKLLRSLFTIPVLVKLSPTAYEYDSNRDWKMQNMLHFMPLISEMCGYVGRIKICLHEFIRIRWAFNGQVWLTICGRKWTIKRNHSTYLLNFRTLFFSYRALRISRNTTALPGFTTKTNMY